MNEIKDDKERKKNEIHKNNMENKDNNKIEQSIKNAINELIGENKRQNENNTKCLRSQMTLLNIYYNLLKA